MPLFSGSSFWDPHSCNTSIEQDRLPSEERQEKLQRLEKQSDSLVVCVCRRGNDSLIATLLGSNDPSRTFGLVNKDLLYTKCLASRHSNYSAEDKNPPTALKPLGLQNCL